MLMRYMHASTVTVAAMRRLKKCALSSVLSKCHCMRLHNSHSSTPQLT
jgi:hypothetical protein